MHNKAFGRLLEQLQKLTFEQTKKVENYLHIKSSIENLEEITGEVNHCPHCESKSFYKWGMRSSSKRLSFETRVV